MSLSSGIHTHVPASKVVMANRFPCLQKQQMPGKQQKPGERTETGKKLVGERGGLSRSFRQY
jgi:hypothetical protein